jgi:hypothetical protein
MHVYKIGGQLKINDCKFIHIFVSFVNAYLYTEKGKSYLLFSETKALRLKT